LRLLCIVMAIALLPTFSGSALVWAPITLDGVFTDWSPVFDSSENCVYDVTGDAGNTNADITVAAVTGDDTYLYHYFRRAAATGGAAPTFVVFLDLNGNQYMESTDRVMQYRLTGGNTFSSAALYRYAPANTTTGDVMGGTMPGTWNTQITFGTPPYSGYGEDGGAQFEGRITWTALGISPKSPISVQFAAQQGSTTDYTGVATLRSYGVTVEPDQSIGKAAGDTAVYTHTVKNTGNSPATFSITATPSHNNWTAVLSQTSVYLLAGQSQSVTVSLTIPANAADGARDTMTITATESGGRATESATDITTVGAILVVPDRAGSIYPSGTIVYDNTITNTTGSPLDVTLTASSAHGWPASVWLGGTDVTGATVPIGTSITVQVLVAVPDTTALGTVDVATVEARASASVRAKGYDTTTVRAALDVSPDNALPAGAGTSVLYRHTITNSTAEERTFTLTANSVKGWNPTVLASDGFTPMPSVTLPAYGGSVQVIVRVTVPAGTPLLVGGVPNQDTTTLTASCSAPSALTDTATDVTTVTSLATYGISGFGTPLNTFDLGDRVYARGMGLTPGNTMTFVWSDPADVDVSTSNARVDATGIAQSSYNIGTALSNIGTWTVRLYNGTTLVDTKQFYVGYKASISSLAATGGDLPNSLVNVSAAVTNSGAAALNGTSVYYRIWWDADGNSAPSVGDSYVEQSGAWTAVGSGSGYTKITSGVNAAPGVTVPDSWSVSNNDFRESGTYMLTAVWMSGGAIVDERTTTFFAVPGVPALSVSVSQSLIDFGAIQPGVAYSQPLTVGVTALVNYTLSADPAAGQVGQLGLSHSFTAADGSPTSLLNYPDTVSILVPWTTDPGSYAASITYTIVAR
jgi:hypothetical protein